MIGSMEGFLEYPKGTIIEALPDIERDIVGKVSCLILISMAQIFLSIKKRDKSHGSARRRRFMAYSSRRLR